jgi:hypothetical protein
MRFYAASALAVRLVRNKRCERPQRSLQKRICGLREIGNMEKIVRDEGRMSQPERCRSFSHSMDVP